MENLYERRKFVFLEITRKNGNIEKAYAVCKESYKLKIENDRNQITLKSEEI